jgi:HlyD family secretion protein
VVRFDSTDAVLTLEKQENTLEANAERTKITTGNQKTDETVLQIDKTDAEKEYEYAMTVLPQDETIFSKWDIIEAKINAGFAKERINFLANKGRVQKRIARSDQQILAIEKNRAQTEIAITKQTLAALELKSPRDGLLLYRRDRMREPQIGDETWQGQVLVELIDLAALQARIYVLERDAGSLSKDKPVVIRLDAIPEREFHGTVRSVTALAQPLERNSPLKYFTCEVTIRDAGHEDLKRIKPGMYLKADVVLEKYDSCFVVPAGAVTTKGTETLVYVKQGEKFVPRPVKVGAETHGQSTILSGVEESELIAMRNPFESRKAHLPDFSKAGAASGAGGGVRVMFRGGPGH